MRISRLTLQAYTLRLKETNKTIYEVKLVALFIRFYGCIIEYLEYFEAAVNLIWR